MECVRYYHESCHTTCAHSTLTKSMMGVMLIAKLTEQFFSPGALPLSSLGSVLLFSHMVSSGPLFIPAFLTLTSAAVSGWLFPQCCRLNIISPGAETQHVTILQGWTMEEPASQGTVKVQNPLLSESWFPSVTSLPNTCETPLL